MAKGYETLFYWLGGYNAKTKTPTSSRRYSFFICSTNIVILDSIGGSSCSFRAAPQLFIVSRGLPTPGT